MSSDQFVLTINGGSSSIKFAIFQGDNSPVRMSHGKIDRIGQKNVCFEFHDLKSNQNVRQESIGTTTYEAASRFLIEWLYKGQYFQSIAAIGHRVVHGMHHQMPELVTSQLLEDLRRISSCDPQHLPFETDLIEAFQDRLPTVRQYACFDTGFHQSMPNVAKRFAIPRRFNSKGIQRYGFHGLSYAYQMQELIRLGDPAAKEGRVILAHLGNGASLCAIRDGKSIDTSMGFTPTAGLPMSTRSGDLDPGIVSYLARTEQMSVADFDQMVNHESGLLGISESSSDMRDLLELESTDIRAVEAIELFCYQTKKWIGGYVAALGGLNTLVFAGGIGENCQKVRSQICRGLSCLGIEIDNTRNEENADVISSANSNVTVRVIQTDEEQMIARYVNQMMLTEVSE